MLVLTGIEWKVIVTAGSMCPGIHVKPLDLTESHPFTKDWLLAILNFCKAFCWDTDLHFAFFCQEEVPFAFPANPGSQWQEGKQPVSLIAPWWAPWSPAVAAGAVMCRSFYGSGPAPSSPPPRCRLNPAGLLLSCSSCPCRCCHPLMFVEQHKKRCLWPCE